MAALRIVFLVLAIGVLGLLGWRSVGNRGAPPVAVSRPAEAPTIAALEQAMRSPPAVLSVPPLPDRAALPASPADRVAVVPAFAGFYDRLKGEFPRDYATVLAHADPASSPDAAIWEAMRDLEQSQGVLAAQAGAGALDRFFDARSALLDGLAPLNARQCVDFLYGVTDVSITDFTAAHHDLVAALADRTLDAIADGRMRHLDRIAPTEADLDGLSAGLAARGLTASEIGLLIDGTTPDPPLPDDRLCAIGRRYLDALHGLPADIRQRIYGLAAELLARS